MSEHAAHGHEWAMAQLGPGFTSATAPAHGTELHYVCGGAGPVVLLLHGFPQDWFEWRRVMSRLAGRFTVLAVDLRGVGGSAPARSGYAAGDLAQDVRELLGTLGIDRAHVVGHDIGGWVSYALARAHPELVESVVVMETLLPGIGPDPAPGVEVPLWHLGFHLTPDLPEALVAGRQQVYFRHFLDTGTVDPSTVGDPEVAHYAWAYRDPSHLPAAFETYRAIPENIAFNRAHTAATEVPLLLVGGEHVFGPALPATAESLRRDHGWSEVRVQVLDGARHYLPEERPDDVAALIEGHAGPPRT